MTTETHVFQTEVKQLLDLMIHSLYSNKEIFLRELISNSSDALDKLRFTELTEHNLTPSPKEEKGIWIQFDAAQQKIVIEDNGIGMTKDELMQNLGTIANSGTKKFLAQLTEQNKKDSQLIGQFGVGFYASFMIASCIVVESKSAINSPAYRWISKGDGSYNIEPCDRQDRGTRIELILKDDEKEFADEWKLRGIIKKYSNYVTYPVYLKKADSDEESRINDTMPVWSKSKRDNKPEDYQALYKQISMDFRDPLLWEHMNIEGNLSFQSVVFVPKEAPFDLYNREKQNGLHLYVNRVSIMEKCKELIPEYLRFCSGVVETNDIPLNVSREILQQNTRLPAIKKQITKKILGSLAQLLQNDKDQYLEFYKNFGSVLKEGFYFDHDQHGALADLVLFHSSKTGADKWVSFKDYVDNRATEQKAIYYLTGPQYEAIARSPHLEALTARGIEVLFFTDPIDEWVVNSFPKYHDFELKAIHKGDLDLTGVGTEPSHTSNAQEDAAQAQDLDSLLTLFKDHLKDDVQDVKISKRLQESACCLIAAEGGLSVQMEAMLKAAGQAMGSQKRILELNPNHPLVQSLSKHHKSGIHSDQLNDWVDVLYETALLAEGSPSKNPGLFAKRLTKMMEIASSKV